MALARRADWLPKTPGLDDFMGDLMGGLRWFDG